MVWIIFSRYYRGNRPFPDIKSMFIKTSSFFTIFHFEIVSILIEWMTNVQKIFWNILEHFKNKHVITRWIMGKNMATKIEEVMKALQNIYVAIT